jgi:signal transduction histidine kinase
MKSKAFIAILIGFVIGSLALSMFTIFHRTYWRLGGGYGPGGGQGGFGGRHGQGPEEDLALFIKRNIVPFITGGISGAAISYLYYRMRQSLKRLRKAQIKLRTSQKLAAVGEIAAGLAHEIRNPLGSIDGAAELLAREFPDDHPKREIADILQKESKRLKEKLNRFLEFARHDEISLGECDLSQELRAVVELLQNNTCCHGHRIELKGVPVDPLIMADCQKLRQVFLNLGINALEAMPEGGGLEISARESRIGGVPGVAIAFKDTGVGMDKEQIEKAFNPFFTSKPGGTGLGLSISHRIVEEHGGGIEIESKPGRGTTVTVTIPRERSDEPQGTDS